MTERVQYLIAQYQADPLRKEPRNVGVIARMDGRTHARFIGEKEDGRIDGREIRWMSYPDVYRQWVFFWRETGAAVAQLEQLLESNKGNYGLVRGGKVSDIGSDSLEQVVDHLFTRFVSGGFAEAMRTVDQITVPSRKLENAIEIELLGMDILVEDDMPKEGVKHPVRRNHVVQGRREVPFTPAFSQENGALWLIETFDFTGPKQRPLFEHAGFTAYMFSDIRKARGTSKVQAISVLKTDPEAEESKHIANSRKVLLNEGEVVDWNDEVQRKAFLEERRHVALS